MENENISIHFWFDYYQNRNIVPTNLGLFLFETSRFTINRNYWSIFTNTLNKHFKYEKIGEKHYISYFPSKYSNYLINPIIETKSLGYSDSCFIDLIYTIEKTNNLDNCFSDIFNVISSIFIDEEFGYINHSYNSLFLFTKNSTMFEILNRPNNIEKYVDIKKEYIRYTNKINSIRKYEQDVYKCLQNLSLPLDIIQNINKYIFYSENNTIDDLLFN